MGLIAMDTETQNGLAVLITTPMSFCEPTSWDSACDYLRRFKEMMCWNSDYDCQAVLKFLPPIVRNRLALLSESRFGLYRIRYVKKKFMKVWHDDKLLFTVYDLFQFYNCKLEKAAKELGYGEKSEFPKSWYTQIKTRLQDPKTRDKVLSYGLQDARLVQRIIGHTIWSFAMAGIKFEKPYSCASFAQRFFLDKFKCRRLKEVERYAEKAYHGGRIECLQAGFFANAYYYDIRSAYPSAISNLEKPDGEWISCKYVRGDSVYAFVDCLLEVPKTETAGPIPYRRRTGVIVYPAGKFRKTVTLPEYRYLEKRGWIHKIFNAWCHVWSTGEKPFKGIYELYRRRLAHPEQAYALKIIMNASYGKMAQTLKTRSRTNHMGRGVELFDGQCWTTSVEAKEYTSFVYAATITAMIRMRVLEEMPHDSVIMYATDGVLTTRPIEANLGIELGQWDFKEVRNLCVVGSGVYSYESEDKKGKEVTTVKFRGFSSGIPLVPMLRKSGRRHAISMSVLRNTSLRRALNNPSELNVLRPVRRVMNVNFDRKRYWDKRWNAGDLTRQSFGSKILTVYPTVTLPLIG